MPFLVFAYLFAPGHPLAVLGGLPFGPLTLALVLVFGIVLYGWGGRLPGRPAAVLASMAALLIVGKVALWAAAPAYGLTASYYSRARVGGTPERSTEFPGVPYTRLDQRPGQDGFARFFFNDVERFNYYEDKDPSRSSLPFAVRWDGYLQAPHDGEYPITLRGRGAAFLAVDGRPLLTIGAGPGERSDRTTLTLGRGPHPLRVEYVYSGADVPSLGLEWEVGDRAHPLAAPHLTVEPVEAEQLGLDAWLAWLARVIDGSFIAMLLTAMALVMLGRGPISLSAAKDRVLAAGGEQGHRRDPTPRSPARRDRPLLALFLVGVLAYAFATTADLYRQPVILEGGQDWLTYESYARDIQLNGPLMTLGKPLGQGRPFFFQPFYPYYLAALHWLTGEDLWGVTVLQIFGLGVCGVLLYHLTARLFGRGAALCSLGLFIVLVATQLDWVARRLLSENLYFLLLPAAVLLLVRYLDERSGRDLILAGLVLGLASITRAPTLLYVPAAAAILLIGHRRDGSSLRASVGAAATVLVLTAAVAALVPLRNWVVSGRPSLVATNGGATLLLAHPPTSKVRLGRVNENRLYNALNLDRQTREVLEFVRQDPLGYAATLVPLGLYALGVSGAVDGPPTVAPEILGLSVLYLAALATLPGVWSLRVWLLHLFVGLHFMVMMTFLPYVYGYRQVLPMQLLMLVVAGGLIAHVGRRSTWPGGAAAIGSTAIRGGEPLAQQRAP